jgi:hypothetical protein
VAIGFGVVFGAVVGWSLLIGEQLFGAKRGNEYVVVREDGTPLISSSPSVYGSNILRTLEGVEVADEGPIRQLPGADLASPHAGSRMRYPLDWRSRICPFVDERRPAGYWYFIHDGQRDGSGYFVGFDSRNKLRIGYIGAQGFRPDEPPPEERFPVSGRSLAAGATFGDTRHYGAREPYYVSGEKSAYMISADRLLEIDFRTRSVSALLEAEGLVSVDSLSRPEPPLQLAGDLEQHRRWRTFTAIRTAEQVVLWEQKTRAQHSYQLPSVARDKRLRFYEIREGLALLDVVSDDERGERHDLLWLDPSGQTLRQEQVCFETRSIFNDPRAEAWCAAGAVPAPVVAMVAVPFQAMQHSAAGTDPTATFSAFLADYRRAVAETWLPLVLVLAVAAGAAGLCYRRQRRYALPGTAVWVIFVLLGGIPALLGYLWHRRWPVLEPCPACGQVVPRDREQCARCGVEFPVPKRHGIEVFAA